MVRSVLALLAVFGCLTSYAQLSNPLSARVINYKTLVDDPYDINQAWISLNPMTVHAGSDNVSLGFGANVRAFATQKLQITAGFHTSFATGTDLQALAAKNNASIHFSQADGRQEQTYKQINSFGTFGLVEGVVQYAFSDKETKGTSKIMLTSKKSRIMEFTTTDEIQVNSRRRHTFVARLGGQYLSSTVSLNKALEKQHLSLTGEDGTILTPDGQTVGPNASSGKYRNLLYSTLHTTTIAVGGSYQLIRNVSIKADQFGNLANNIILTTFADLLVAPSTHLADLQIAQPGGGYQTYSAQSIVVRNIGFRMGADVVYNQELHYSFGGELGVRPGLLGQGFYVAGRVSFPTLGFRLSHRRVANQTNGS